MAAVQALIDHQLGTLQHLNYRSKVDDEAALGICPNQKIFPDGIPFCDRTVLERREKQRAVQNLSPHRHSYMEREVAWVQCRELLTASYRSVCSSFSFRNTPPAHANPVVSFSD